METYTREDLRRSWYVARDGVRYVIAEFIDEYNRWCMGFFTFQQSVYVLREVPRGVRPSEVLFEQMWRLLDTVDTPLLKTPTGYYFGYDFHSLRGMYKDITIIHGYPIGSLQLDQGPEYNLIMSCEGCNQVAFFGVYAGVELDDMQRERPLWYPIPFPTALCTNDVLDVIYGILEGTSANLLMFTAQLQ